MAEISDGDAKPIPSLSDRVEFLRREIQALIVNGVEHPDFEFKRSMSIVRENLEDRLDFIKLFQGIANSDGLGEKCIVIGGDPKEKRFYPVANADEFDQAKLSSILGKYLDPVPGFEVFNNLTNENGEPFVAIVLSPAQSKPIVVKTEGRKPACASERFGSRKERDLI